MTEHAVTVGQFAGYTSLATGDVRFKIDIPREHLGDALRIFGDAIGAQVSVARLTEPTTTEDESRPSRQDPAEPGGKPDTKPRTPWHELTRAQQAGIRCGEERFANFLAAEYPATLCNSNAAQAVRDICHVSSRSLLDTVCPERWDALDARYRAWAGLDVLSRDKKSSTLERKDDD